MIESVESVSLEQAHELNYRSCRRAIDLGRSSELFGGYIGKLRTAV